MAARSGNKISLFEKHFGWCPGSARPGPASDAATDADALNASLEPKGRMSGCLCWLPVVCCCLFIAALIATTTAEAEAEAATKFVMLQLQRNATRTLKVSVTFYATLQLLRGPCAFSFPSCPSSCKYVGVLWACTLWQSVAVSLINWAARSDCSLVASGNTSYKWSEFN